MALSSTAAATVAFSSQPSASVAASTASLCSVPSASDTLARMTRRKSLASNAVTVADATADVAAVAVEAFIAAVGISSPATQSTSSAGSMHCRTRRSSGERRTTAPGDDGPPKVATREAFLLRLSSDKAATGSRHSAARVLNTPGRDSPRAAAAAAASPAEPSSTRFNAASATEKAVEDTAAWTLWRGPPGSCRHGFSGSGLAGGGGAAEETASPPQKHRAQAASSRW